MGLFQRISDIVSANLNELTDNLENPEPMLKQAIREMEISIHGAKQETVRAMANEKSVNRELDNNLSQVQKWQERAQQAVAAGDDALARKALMRKQEHEKLVAALEDQRAIAKDASRSLKRQLEAMQAKLSEAKRNLATLSARHRAADFRKKMQAVDANVASEFDRDAFAKFDRLKNRVEQAEAEAEAYAELSDWKPAAAELDELFEPNNDAEIDAELAELKRESSS